jgi:DNA (cytosine-5)-methyltransferase 1
MLGVSLFSSVGISDLALQANGISVIVANELLPKRSAVFRRNFPDVFHINGDIVDNSEAIVSATLARLKGKKLDFLIATPPCQGMSPNGMGKLLSEIKAGRRTQFDPRNQLIIPTLAICDNLQPETIIFENVANMQNTLISSHSGEPINIMHYIQKSLGQQYTVAFKVVEFADYGVPQRRQRLITICTKNKNLIRYLNHHGCFLPPPTHSKEGDLRPKWRSVRQAIAHLPPLDACSDVLAQSSIPFHNVPVLEDKKYYWVSHTPPEKGAFDNQCVQCGYTGNPTHSSQKDRHGVNKASRKTPLYCLRCSALLPRPWVYRQGSYSLMSGFTSAYKRMAWDLPASTLTSNLQYACSDHKLHPEQHRVLSLYEAFIIHTLDKYTFHWEGESGNPVAKTLIAEAIGESVPPYGLDVIVKHLVSVIKGDTIYSDCYPLLRLAMA